MLPKGKALFNGMFNDSVVEIFFGRKMTENDGFGHTGRFCNGSGCGTFESFFGKEGNGHFGDLRPPIFLPMPRKPKSAT